MSHVPTTWCCMDAVKCSTNGNFRTKKHKTIMQICIYTQISKELST